MPTLLSMGAQAAGLGISLLLLSRKCVSVSRLNPGNGNTSFVRGQFKGLNSQIQLRKTEDSGFCVLKWFKPIVAEYDRHIRSLINQGI